MTTSKTAFILMLIASTFLACDKQTDDIVADQPGLNPATLDAGDRDVKPGKCPAEFPGPALVEVAAPDGTRYCIDRTEVTQRDYFEFLDAHSTTGSWREKGFEDSKIDAIQLPESCKTVPNLVPDPWSPPCDRSASYAFDWDGLHPDNPIACVDWCSASAYCLWAGKRLCGAVGGGPIEAGDRASASKNQWFNACSQGGKTTYSYGDAFEANACAPGGVSIEPSAEGGYADLSAEAVESYPECHGGEPGFDQVLNLSGSVAEWVDGPCQDFTDGKACGVQPGTSAKETQCASGELIRIMGDAPYVGFRCCFDL